MSLSAKDQDAGAVQRREVARSGSGEDAGDAGRERDPDAHRAPNGPAVSSAGETATRDHPGKRDKAGGIGNYVRGHPWTVGIGAVAVVAVVAAGTMWWLAARHFESTDDAFIDARSFSVAAKVGGYLTDVPVTDNQHVESGALIGRIDDRDYVAMVDQMKAQVDAALANVEGNAAQILNQGALVSEAQAQVRQNQASLEFSRDENGRAQDLVNKGAGTLQRAQQTASQLSQAQAALAQSEAALKAAETQVAVLKAQGRTSSANVQQARAQLAQAELNLGYTDVKAAQAGRIARLSAAKGQLVQAGQALTMFVPDELWVTANFKETQLADMRPSQSVDMRIDAYPGRVFTGRVDSVQRGSGTVFSLLPAQNATGNYVKVVQRVPVKIVFDDLPNDVAIGPGMSVVPKVRVR